MVFSASAGRSESASRHDRLQHSHAVQKNKGGRRNLYVCLAIPLYVTKISEVRLKGMRLSGMRPNGMTPAEKNPFRWAAEMLEMCAV